MADSSTSWRPAAWLARREMTQNTRTSDEPQAFGYGVLLLSSNSSTEGLCLYFPSSVGGYRLARHAVPQNLMIVLQSEREIVNAPDEKRLGFGYIALFFLYPTALYGTDTLLHYTDRCTLFVVTTVFSKL